MKRREALKTLGFATLGLAVLPSCARDWASQEIVPGSTSFSAKEQQLLSSVADTILPAKDSLGAIAQGVDKFLIRLFDECYEEPIRENIKTQLAKLDEKAEESSGKSFTVCEQQKREELLLTFNNSEHAPEKEFFDLVKAETIRGFKTTRVVMQDFYGYSVMPGFYNGNVDVEA